MSQVSWAKMEDVARLAGVTTMTVSRAYNQPERVSEAARNKIFTAADALGYIPNATAGNLRSNKTNLIAAIVPTIANSSFVRSIEGIAACLDQNGYELALGIADEDPKKEERTLSTFLGRRPLGIILMGNERSEGARNILTRSAIPVVEMWTVKPPHIDRAVGFSSLTAVAELTSVIIRSGRRRIGYIDVHQPRVQRYAERREGFLSAVTAAGLPSNLIHTSQTSSGYLGGRQGLASLLKRNPEMDAVVCSTDILATGALFECQHRSITVPDEMAVSGFGDYEIAEHIPPGLTTIRSRGYEMGREAASLLLRRIAGESELPMVIDVGYEIVSRGSS